METKTQTQEVLTAGKAVYEKPTSQVYELEVEGAIMSGSDVVGAGTSPIGTGSDDGWY